MNRATMEEANAAALKASMAGDLEGLKRALADRAEAIADLLRGDPTEQLLSRVRNAIRAGEFIAQDLWAVRGRIAMLRSAIQAEGAARPVLDLRG